MLGQTHVGANAGIQTDWQREMAKHATREGVRAWQKLRSAFATVWPALLLPLLRRDSLRVQADLPGRSSPEEGGKPEGERRLAERGGFGLDMICEIRPNSNYSAQSRVLTTRTIRTSLATNPQMGLS
jgi:hypothetical protein